MTKEQRNDFGLVLIMIVSFGTILLTAALTIRGMSY